MKLPYLLYAVAPLLFVLISSSAASVDPKAISKEIERHGAKATVARLTSSRHARNWESTLQHIETGDPDWLVVAANLADGTDAGTSEELQIALAIALPRNPPGVLNLAGTQSFLSIRDLCGAPFIEPTDEYLKHYLIDARRALQRLPYNSSIEQKKVQCLSEIDNAIEEIFSRPTH